MSAMPDNMFADPKDSLIADLQRQLATSNAERDEASAREIAITEVLRVICASPGDLAPVFNVILEKSLQLCGAALGELHTYDGERFHPVAFHGASAEYIELRMQTPPSGSPGTGSGRILETKRPVYTLDAVAQEAYRTGDPSRRLMADVGGARTGFSVPLLRNETVLGVITIYRKEVCPFTEKQIALVEISLRRQLSRWRMRGC